MLTLADTFNGDRRERATDARGLPTSYARALTALEGCCAHCTERALVADGSGVGLCARHRRERTAAREDGIRARERARRQIDIMKRAGVPRI